MNYTDLLRAINIGNIEVLKSMGTEVAFLTNAKKQTLLHYCVKRAKLDAILILLEFGADPLAEDNRGNTPLRIAIKNNSKLAMLLLASIHYSDISEDILHMACGLGEADIVSMIVAIKSRGLINSYLEGRTSIHWAAQAGSAACLKILLQCGADVNSIEKESGNTPLHIAAAQNDIGCVLLLLYSGANLYIKNIGEPGFNPAEMAEVYGSRETADILYKALVNQRFG